MPMKEILHRLQPIQIYVVLMLSTIYLLVQFYISQRSQSITLLVHTYHMLCNVIALSGCIITIKNDDSNTKPLSSSTESFKEEFTAEDRQIKQNANEKKKQQQQTTQSLKNTFGWARVDVLNMVISCTFLTSLCFSIVVEVIQTLFHVSHNDHLEHKDEFHSYTYEICIVLGALGLVLNGISYLLIGGYTFHQGSFLHLTADGNVYIASADSRRPANDCNEEKLKRKSQLLHNLSRDACSAVMVIICSVIYVMCEDVEVMELRLVDPILSLVSITILLTLSYPYMKEAGMVLLQTIPDSIDIYEFQKQILKKFPQIDSLHDLHIWQLTRTKLVLTAHIIFQDPSVYKNVINDIIDFLHEQDINIITIQPEFQNLSVSNASNGVQAAIVNGHEQNLCLVACREIECEEKLCCQRRHSRDSSDSKQNSQVLEQVISVKDVSSEELKVFTSMKSLDEISEDNQKSTVSLPSHSKHKKLLKTMSVINHHHHHELSEMPSGLVSDDIHLVSFKRVMSESVIKNNEHDEMGRQDSEILVENRLLKQISTTDNHEMEDIYTKTNNDEK